MGSEIVSALVTLSAAFVGAWSAFKLEDRARKRRTVEERIAAGNRAMFVLMRMFNELFVYQQRVLEPVRARDARSVLLLKNLSRNHEGLRFEVEKLSFLLETAHRQVLTELLIEEERFYTVVGMINKRSDMHLADVQPALEKAGIGEGQDHSEVDVDLALGTRRFRTMQRLTADIFTHVDKNVISLLEMSKRLHSALSKLYPKARFIRFEPDKAALEKAET